MSADPWVQWCDEATSYYQRKWMLKHNFAKKIAVLNAWALMYGIKFTPTSGYRDPQKQAALRAAWDRGDRQGLKVRPALKSKHCEGIALDISSDRLDILGSWAPYARIKWGGTFSTPDTVHFEDDGSSGDLI